MRRLLLIAGALVLLVVVAGAGTAAWLLRDPSRYIPGIEAAASRALGRAVRVGGLRVHPDLTVEATDVTIANHPGKGRAEALILPRATARIELIGLLAGRIDIDDVRLERPDIALDDATFDTTANPPASNGPTSGSAIRLRPRWHTITIVDGRLSVIGLTLDVPRAQATRTGDGWRATASVERGANTADLVGSLPYAGGWGVDATARLTLKPNVLIGDAPGPSQLSVHVGEDVTRATIVRGSRRVALVTAPVAALNGPGSRPVDLVVEQAGASLHFTGAALRSGAFDGFAQARAPDLAALSARSPPGPASADAHAVGTLVLGGNGEIGGHIALEHLVLATSAGDLTGTLAIADDQTTPSLQASLIAKRLDIDALLRAARAVATPPPRPVPAIPATNAVPAAAVEPALLPFDRLRDAEGDVTLAADNVTVGGLALHDARLHAVLSEATLVFDPVSATTDAGPVRASLTINALGPPSTQVLMVQAPALRLAAGPLTGIASVRAALSSSGDTIDALLGGLSGSASVAIVDGRADPTAIAIAPALAEATRKLPIALATGPTPIRCVVLRVAAADGVATLEPITLDTPRLLATGSGLLDLRARTMALRLRPLLRGGIGVSVPLLISGTWAAPALAPDPHAPAAVSGDACAASLAAIGVALPLPLPSPARKPADLLRSLLR